MQALRIDVCLTLADPTYDMGKDIRPTPRASTIVVSQTLPVPTQVDSDLSHFRADAQALHELCNLRTDAGAEALQREIMQ